MSCACQRYDRRRCGGDNDDDDYAVYVISQACHRQAVQGETQADSQ